MLDDARELRQHRHRLQQLYRDRKSIICTSRDSPTKRAFDYDRSDAYSSTNSSRCPTLYSLHSRLVIVRQSQQQPALPVQPSKMNGSDIKKAAIQKAKQVAQSATSAANGTNGKKRRKQELKPIVTTEQQEA